MYSGTTRSKPGRRPSKTACVKPSRLIPCGAQATTRSTFVWLIPASRFRNSLSTWVVQSQVISGHPRATGILVFEKHLLFVVGQVCENEKPRNSHRAPVRWSAAQFRFLANPANRKSRGGLSPTPARVFVDVRISGN